MKSLFVVLMLLPCFAVASNSFVTIGYGQLDGALTDMADTSNVDGVSVGFTSVSSQAIFNIEHWEATGDEDGSQTWASASLAFDDFSTGSVYAGLATTDGDLLEETGLVLGYQKLSRQGTDYNFSATSYDGYVVYGVNVIAENGLTLSISDYANAMTVTKVGYSFSF
jgi:hypothetical protein